MSFNKWAGLLEVIIGIIATLFIFIILIVYMPSIRGFAAGIVFIGIARIIIVLVVKVTWIRITIIFSVFIARI